MARPGGPTSGSAVHLVVSMAVCVCRVGVVCGGRGGRRRNVHRHRLLLRTSSFSILVRLRIISSNFITSTLRGGAKGPSPRTWPPTSSRRGCKKTFYRPGLSAPYRRTPLGELTAFSSLLSGGEEASCPFPIPPPPLSALWASGFSPRPWPERKSLGLPTRWAGCSFASTCGGRLCLCCMISTSCTVCSVAYN